MNFHTFAYDHCLFFKEIVAYLQKRNGFCWNFNGDLALTGAIFETGAYGVPSKSPKLSICGEVRQTISLKSPGKGVNPPQPNPGGYSGYPCFGCSTKNQVLHPVLDF